MGFDHPITWCKDYQGGRSFYTALGHTAAVFRGPRLPRAPGRRASTGPPASPTRSTATAARPSSPTTSRPDRRAAEPQRADRLRPVPRRAGDPDRPAAAACGCTTRRRHLHVIAQIPVYTDSEDGLYGPAVDNDFATNQLGLPLLLAADDGRAVPAVHADGRRAAPPQRRPRASGTRGRATSSSRASSSSTAATPDARPRERAEDPEGRRSTAARAVTSPATSTSTATTTSGWSPATTRRRRRQLGRLLAVQRHDDQRDADRAHRERDRRHVHADLPAARRPRRSPTTRPPRRSQAALEALAGVGAGNVVASGGPVSTANVSMNFRGALSAAGRGTADRGRRPASRARPLPP